MNGRQKLRPLFPLGQIVATPAPKGPPPAALETAGQAPYEFLVRHVCGMWGDLVVYDLEQQAEMAILAETTLAAMLVRKDWLNNGTRAEDAVRGWMPEEALERDTRVDEMGDVPF